MGLSKLIYFGREKMNYEEYDIDDTGFDEDNFGIADIGKLGEYFDMLYEDAFENKVHGTFMVMQLAKQPENLEALLTNGQGSDQFRFSLLFFSPHQNHYWELSPVC